MPPTCSICRHQDRNDIDRALAGPDSLRAIARRFHVTSSSLDRHRRHHLAPLIARSLARHEELSAERLASWLLGVNEQLLVGVVKAKGEDDYLTIRALSSEIRKNIETIARLGGFLEAPSVVVDARQQTAVLASMTEGELRALVAADSQVLPPPARELVAGELAEDR
jgi:hypothetical protein